MSPSPPFFLRLWWIIPVAALGFLFWTTHQRIERASYVTSIGQETPGIAADSASGYFGGARQLVVPEHVDASYEWIAQTQQMLARSEWRVRRIAYENAPFGREVHAASPYRWWLAALACCDHALSGRPLGLALERAALWADPLLQAVLAVLGTILAARYFGRLAAALFSIGAVVIFPLAASFVPGAPDDFALVELLALGSVLALLAGFRAKSRVVTDVKPLAAPRDDGGTAWFVAGGVLGGAAVWLNAATQMPLLLGLAVGGLLATWIARRGSGQSQVKVPSAAAWRGWSLAGAATILLAYLIEYFPGQLGTMELRAVHPLYGVCWLGLGELVALGVAGLAEPASGSRKQRTVLGIVLAMLAIASVPVAMWQTGNLGILAPDLLSYRLTKQADGIMAPNVAAWLKQGAAAGSAWATFLPLLVIGGGGLWLSLRASVLPAARVALAMVLGPLAVATAMACSHLRWWQVHDGLLLVALLPATWALAADKTSGWIRCSWISAVLVAVGSGAPQLFPAKDAAGKYVISIPEVEGLVERDLAAWLAKRSGAEKQAVVLAPPSVTKALYYYGGLRGLGSLAWENKDGLSVALRIVISTSPEEAHELARRRELSYIVVPSWDPFFENYTSSASVQTGELLLTGLHRWAQPTWLRPLSYQMPSIPGFEQQSVLVFEVVEDQGEVLSLCRLLEYFAEMGQAENARAVGRSLKRFPMDFSALIARTQLEAALGDPAEFSTLFESLVKRLTAGADRTLPWDRRLSLAGALARGQRFDLARTQVERALATVDETKLRSLSSYALYHLQVLMKAGGLAIKDAKLKALALDLLPAELRSNITQ